MSRAQKNDSETVLSVECEKFQDDDELDKSIENVFVKCSSGGKIVYSNAHAIIAKQHRFHDRQQREGLNKEKAFKVIMLGLDAMSRINFQRGMPKSHKMIENKREWFEVKGYTTLNNSTFPNLFTILTGQSANENYKRCDPRSPGFLDECSFIWKNYEKGGYVTLYAEDQMKRNTFNVWHKGFNKQPTDHYFRPFVVTAEKMLPVSKKGDLAFCLGASLYMEHIFVYAVKLLSIHQKDPYFSIFYVNSLSDKQLSSSPIMDNKISESFVKTLEEKFNMNDTIVIYFADTGTRFEEELVSVGSYNHESITTLITFQTGFYEERAPLLFIRLPPRFQKTYPDYVQNLKINSKRLTTPFDLHITLRHILNLSAEKKVPLKAIGCKNCKSLFDPISIGRSCSNVNIPDESCPCSLVPLKTSLKVVKLAAQHAIDVLNKNLKTMKTKSGEHCAMLSLGNITSANQQLTSKSNLNYILRFTVTPSKAQYEVLLRRKASTLFSLSPQFELLNEILHTNVDKEPIVCISKSTKRMETETEVEMDYSEDWDLLDDSYFDTFIPK